MSRTTIELHPSGDFFDFADPRPAAICVEDIARSLSMQCRFGGFVERFYSVAEHALLVHRLVRDVAGPELAFAALHHDSHEAYLGDVPTPLKRLLGGVMTELAGDVDDAICRSFGFPDDLFHHDIIKDADEQALRIEASVLKVSRGAGPHWTYDKAWTGPTPTGAVACYDPQWVEHLFLAAHHRLAGDLACVRLGLAA